MIHGLPRHLASIQADNDACVPSENDRFRTNQRYKATAPQAAGMISRLSMVARADWGRDSEEALWGKIPGISTRFWTPGI